MDAGAGLDAAPDSPPAAQDAVDAARLVPIWRPDSLRLEVWCSLGFGSISRFEADRDQLTQAQLGALASLRARLSGMDSVCYVDGASCVVDILSAGDRLTVRGPLESDCDESYRVITRASFQPLFNLLDCHAASRSRDGPLRPHPHCQRGLYATGLGDVWVEVPEAGAFEFELSHCALPEVTEPVVLQLLDEAGAMLLEGRAPEDPGPRRTCRRMVHTFMQPGRFRIRTSPPAPPVLAGMTLRFARPAAPP